MGNTVQSHRDLKVWQKAMDLAVEIYRLAGTFPHSETYRLAAQITRAAASVPANIAEGHARATRRDFANFVAIAKGSRMEAETFLMLPMRLDYLIENEASVAMGLITENSKMLTALRSRLVTGDKGVGSKERNRGRGGPL